MSICVENVNLVSKIVRFLRTLIINANNYNSWLHKLIWHSVNTKTLGKALFTSEEAKTQWESMICLKGAGRPRIPNGINTGHSTVRGCPYRFTVCCPVN